MEEAARERGRRQIKTIKGNQAAFSACSLCAGHCSGHRGRVGGVETTLMDQELSQDSGHV